MSNCCARGMAKGEAAPTELMKERAVLMGGLLLKLLSRRELRLRSLGLTLLIVSS